MCPTNQSILLAALVGLSIFAARHASTATINTDNNNCDNNNEALEQRVKPFSDDFLPKSQLGGELLPGLGKLMLLDTYMRPMSLEKMGTSFSVYTRNKTVADIRFKWERTQTTASTTTGAQQYHFDLCRLAETGFDPGRRTVVMIPGYRSSEWTPWVTDSTDNWFKLHGDNVQVVVVSWNDTNHGVYSQAVSHTTIIARQVTIFLNYLLQIANVDLDDQRLLDKFHLIGHSLGAHISGFVGQDFGGRLGRITGLDPAGPSFDSFPRTQRLDRNDARLVEVLHTNSGKLKYFWALANVPLVALISYWQGDNSNGGPGDNSEGLTTSGTETTSSKWDGACTAWFGINIQSGHVDYYANDGSEQPGCGSKMHICDHKRATEIYLDMLRYENSLRVYEAAHPSETKLARLMAFKASNYESFEAGESLALECANLLCTHNHHHHHHLSQNDHQVGTSKSNCAIPLLDFVRPLEELIGELRDKHGINFEPEAKPEDQPRFYFKTSAGSLLAESQNYFLGDHYLLRVYLDETSGDQTPRRFSWLEPAAGAPNWCSLRVQLSMDNGEAAILHIGHLRPSLVEALGGKRWMVAIPFVHPHGSFARIQLANLLRQGLDDGRDDDEEDNSDNGLSNENEPPSFTTSDEQAAKQRSASANASAIFRQLFPRTITLGVSEHKHTSAAPNEPTCRLEIKAIEVTPLDGQCRSVGALYGNRLALNRRTPIMTGEQLIERLEQSSESEGEERKATSLATSGKAFRSLGTGLEAILAASE